MNRKSNIAKMYVEAILYSLILIVAIFLCLTDNIYITMFPIAFIVGILGQIIFGKKIMTSFFSGILSIVLLQMKNPSLIWNNLLESIKIFLLVFIGEIFGWAINRLYRLCNKRKNVNKKVKNETIKCSIVSVVAIILGVFLSGAFNGDYVTYYNAKNSLKKYFIEEYYSGSRFKIVSCKYKFSFSNPKYTFYTQDTLSGNVGGRFSVYLKDNYNVQDDYQEQLKNSISDKINSEIKRIYENDEIQILVTNSELNNLTICFTKKVENINKSEIEEYSKEIVDCLNSIKNIDKFEDIEQIKLVLESKNNSKDNLATYIFMSGYNEMIKDGDDDAYLYIMKALNIEYFD